MTTFASAAYYGFEPCCGGPTLYFAFDGTIVVGPTPGINIYEGTGALGYDPLTNTYNLLQNQCYRIFRGTAGPGDVITAALYGNLQMVPTNTPSNYTWDSSTNYETPCGSELITCPTCDPQCYIIYSCEGNYPPITTDTDLSAYVNNFAQIQVDADFGFSCFYVIESDNCNNAVTVEVDGDTPCSCDCNCYEIIGTAKLEYIDCNGNQVVTSTNGYWKDCSLVYPFTNPGPSPNLTIVSHGLCEGGVCPGQCYELTDCAGILDPIYTTAQSLSPYAALGQVVQIQNYENCWEVTDVVSCNCAIDVVVLQVYDNCELCNPAPNYKLTNCDDLNTIIYTSSDLSAHVGQVINVEDNCPGCWIIEEYPNPIPSDIPVIVAAAFNDCEACKTTYYQLTDCTDTEAPIITSTDLSDYVGSIIILEWCPTTCWTVSLSQTSVGAGVLGDISNEFETCIECLTSFPCVCSRLKNHDIVSHNYDYLDCEGNVQTITLVAGQKSERICMAHWLTSYPTDYVEYFGNCTEVDNVFTCPPPVYPKRSLKPGYNTPYCSTWKYEEISCKAAEALYKQVLELRYGISNCCPEEDQQYIIKKQLIDLKALVNPDYVCSTPSCGCNTGCGCGGSCGGSCSTCHS